MYASPIHVNYTEPIVEILKDKFDNAVFRAVQEVGIEVDKDELLKALQYDRGQYKKGYSDGRLYKPPVITNADRIRAMTDDELAKWIKAGPNRFRPCGACPHYRPEDISCHQCWLNWLNKTASDTYWLDWLKQEVEQ